MRQPHPAHACISPNPYRRLPVTVEDGRMNKHYTVPEQEGMKQRIVPIRQGQ